MSVIPQISLALNAMATRFEIVLHGPNPVALRAAGEEALAEIESIESQISLYRPTSQIARVNALAAKQPVRVTPPVFGLLEAARKLSAETNGTFDITIAPLVRCWGFMGGSGRRPTPDDILMARQKIGMHQLELDPETMTIRFKNEGVMIDLGAIGKGYALGCAAEQLREAGISSALLHGGTSTIYAVGHPPDQDHWKIAVQYPRTDVGSPNTEGIPILPLPAQTSEASLRADQNDPPLLTTIALRDQALSVSAVWGRCFVDEGKLLGHVLDPRTGEPVHNAWLSAVVLPSAMESDALSTGLLVMGEEGHQRLHALRPELRTLLVRPGENGTAFKVSSRGIEWNQYSRITPIMDTSSA